MTLHKAKRGDVMTMLKRHRMVKGLTLRELGKRIGVSTAACSSWETGRSMPNPRVLPKLARVLGIDAMALTRLISPDRDAGSAHAA